MGGLSDSGKSNRLASARAALKDLPEERKTLELAAAAVGDPLTVADLEDAFERRKTDDDVRLRVAALSWAVTSCCNQLNAIVQHGSVLAGFREPEAPGDHAPSVTVDYRLLREHGVLTEAQRQRLRELNGARTALTHAYGVEATPADLHKAATLARAVLSTFPEDFGAWLRDVGVLPKQKPAKK